MADHGFWSYAERDSEALALVDPEDKQWTRGELHALCNQIVGVLRDLGLERGDTVALDSPNCAEFFAIYLACTQAGFYLVPVNWHLAPPEVAYIVQDSEAKAFIAHERLGGDCIKAADEIDFPAEGRIAIGSIAGFRSLAKLAEPQSSEPPENRSAGAVMNYTSGTTGRPKGVKRDLAPAELEPDLIMGLFGAFLGMFGVQPGGDEVYICGSPLYHTAVLIHWGHPVVLMEKWTPEDMLRLIEKHRCTTSHMVPTQFHRLLLLPEDVRAKYDVSSTRTMLHAAAPCPPDIKRRMIEWWGPIIHEYYAGTEGNGMCYINSESWLKKPGSVGKCANATLHVCDDDGDELPIGEEGVIYTEQDEEIDLFEYHKDAGKTLGSRNPKTPRWTTLGDVGYVDEDGYLFLTDRKAFMIISGGVNIYPQEIEDAFVMHELVADVAVIGVPNEDFGEEVKAVVQLVDPSSASEELAAELIAYSRQHLAGYKVPRSIDFEEELPRLPTGKLYKRLLRDRYWGKRNSRIV